VVTSAVTWVCGKSGKDAGVPIDRLHFRVGGLVSQTESHVVWLTRILKVGDEVKIAVLESERADKPKSIRVSEAKQVALMKKLLEARMAKDGGKKKG